MKLAWLDGVRDEGYIAAKAIDEVEDRCGALVKAAAMSQQTQSELVRALELSATLMLTPVVGAYLASRSRKKELGAHLADLEATKQKLLTAPIFADQDKDKVEARFTEIARLSPVAARNEHLMMRLVKDKLHSGLTPGDVQSLAMLQATHAPGSAKMTAAEATKTAGALTANSYILCKEAGIIKGAAPWGPTVRQALLHVGTGVAVSGLLSVGTGAVNALATKMDKTDREKKLIHSFSQAMDPNHPETELIRTHPEKAREAFKTLTHFAPNVALEPNAARTFMTKIVDYSMNPRAAGVHTQELKDLVEIEKAMRTTGPSPFFKGLAAGLQATDFAGGLKSTTQAFRDPLSFQLQTQVAKNLGLEHSGKSPFQPLGTSAARDDAAAGEAADKHKRETEAHDWKRQEHERRGNT